MDRQENAIDGRAQRGWCGAACSDGSALASSIQNGKRTSVLSDTERGPTVEPFQATGTKPRTSPAATGRKSGEQRSFRT